MIYDHSWIFAWALGVHSLEAEVIKAELAGKSVVIEMDSNSKLGTNYIPNDPNPMSQNWKFSQK